MSATVNDTTSINPTDRAAIATRRLCEALSLSALKPKELKNLATALAEAASIEISHNPSFHERILSAYQELAQHSTPVRIKGAASRAKATKPQLVVRRHVDARLFGPDRPLDPYLQQYVYEDDQLRAALDRFPASELKKAAAMVEEQNPGLKPANRSKKATLLEYILAQLLGKPPVTY